MTRLIDITGQKFGRLTAIKPVKMDNGKLKWLFKCDCGNDHITNSHTARNGSSRSCGCLFKEWASKRAKRHGLTGTKEYNAWSGMKGRCYYVNSESYRNYGAKGIKVCKRWRESFPAFLEDMGKAPSKDHSLDRIDPKGDYTPENCRWADRKTQGNNKTNNRYIEIDGVTKTLAEWCNISGQLAPRVQNRLDRLGWTYKQAFGFEPRVDGRAIDRYPYTFFVEFDGVQVPLRDLCEKYGIRFETAYSRYKNLGWPIKQALGIEIKPDMGYRDITKEKRTVFIEIDGVRKPLSHWAKEYGISPKYLWHKYVVAEWPAKQALGIEPRIKGQKRKGE